jgi:ATP-binding cassette subfamily F protein 3
MIVVKNVTLRRGSKVLLDNANATVFVGEKVGLVGRNGVGKSSLFSMLTKRLHEESGECAYPAQWRLAEVAQEMPETDMPASEFVVEGDGRLMQARAFLKVTEAAAEANDDWTHIGEAHTLLNDAGEYQAKPRAHALLLGLGFAPHELDLPVNSFSGGWRMRLQLARTLMDAPDLLLLDEPTNHLDLDALVWLETYLQKFEGTMLMISHDREFLDATTQTTIHIENGKLVRYGTNYSGFEDLRAEKMALQMAQYAKQQKQIEHFQSFINRFKAKASKAKQAQSRVKALERMEKVAAVVTEADFSFEFREPQKIPNPLLSVDEVDFGYRLPNGNTLPILKNISLTLLSEQRIGLLGANGRGKSTWIKTIAGAIPPLAGQLRIGKGLAIGYFAQQEMDLLRPERTPLEHYKALAESLGKNLRETELRGFLGSFNFSGEMAHQPVGQMSGGEKARLVLSMIVWQSPNLLLLDEPTNHLDLATREALSMAINGFEGTVILVSHDRALLRAVCDEFWLVADGTIRTFDGDLDDYQTYLLDLAKQRRANELAPPTSPTDRHSGVRISPSQPPTTGTAVISALSPSAIKKIHQEILDIEATMRALEAEQHALSLVSLATLTVDERKKHGARLKQCTATLAEMEETWFGKQRLIEGVKAL